MASRPREEATDPQERSRPALIAHRGFAGVYPENTVAAVERAATDAPTGPDGQPAGAEMIEIDVLPTTTGEVVVFHDTRPGRLTDAPPDLADRAIWNLPYDRLADLEVLASGEPVPLLADVLAAIPPDVAVNVEFKNPGSRDVRIDQHLDGEAFERHENLWRSFAADVAEILAEFPHEVLVSSFHGPAIAAVRAVEPDLPVGFVFQDSVERGLEVAHRYDCEAVYPPMGMIAGTALFDADAYDPTVDLVERAHAEGRAVNVWTVENWYQASQLRQADVDGLIADYPGVLAYERPDEPYP
jgi:glycerophosphoryl diester phosphodiesterase